MKSYEVACPYCKAVVDKKYSDTWCPVCGNMVKTSEFIDIESETYIRSLKKSGVYKQVQELIWNENTDEALKTIRTVIGQKGNIVSIEDDVVEPVVISKILKERPNDWTKTEESRTIANTIVCPYCKQEVNKEYQDKVCPNCGEYVKSKDWIDRQVDSIVRIMKRKGLFEYVSSAIFNGDNNLVIDELRGLSSRDDCVVEQAFVERILKSKPADQAVSEKLVRPNVAYESAKSVSPAGNLTPCPDCGRMISKQAETCPGCGRHTGVHVCPNCGSVNTKTISELSKATSIFMWGIFSANKVKSTYECLDCKQKF